MLREIARRLSHPPVSPREGFSSVTITGTFDNESHETITEMCCTGFAATHDEYRENLSHGAGVSWPVAHLTRGVTKPKVCCELSEYYSSASSPLEAEDDLSTMQTRGNGRAPRSTALARLLPPLVFSLFVSLLVRALCKARRFISAREPRLGLSDRVLTSHQAELLYYERCRPARPWLTTLTLSSTSSSDVVVAVSRAHLRRLGTQRAFFKRPCLT